MRRRFATALAALGLLGGCKLTEVTAADAEDVLVVESLLRAGATQQFVLLHRSLVGRTVRGEPGAVVTVLGPDGVAYRFSQAAASACSTGHSGPADSLIVEPTCYVAPRRLSVRPGARYELSVTTAGGERVRGATSVPGAFALRVPAATGACRLPPGTNLPLLWSVAPGAWSYIASLEIRGLGSALRSSGIPAKDRIELTAVSISERDTTLVLPAQFGVFEATDLDPKLVAVLQNGLPEGVAAHLELAAMDRNYVNAVRGGNFNPSGSVRISSVVGDGVGVFGSLVPLALSLEVAAQASGLPSCLGAP